MRRMRQLIGYLFAFGAPMIALTITGSVLLKKYYLKPEIRALLDVKRRDLASVRGDGWPEKSPALFSSVSNSEKGLCKSVEIGGDGTPWMRIAPADWQQVLIQFKRARGSLLSWLKQREKDFPAGTLDYMRKQAQAIRLVKPPIHEEPDLNWRGIAVFARDEKGSPLIRVGGGFAKLAAQKPERARFELARLIAQAWSPCELMKAGNDQPWTPYLTCLGMSEPEAECRQAPYAPSSWAVSSGLATLVSRPGCRLPAFSDPKQRGCVSQIIRKAGG